MLKAAFLFVMLLTPAFAGEEVQVVKITEIPARACKAFLWVATAEPAKGEAIPTALSAFSFRDNNTTENTIFCAIGPNALILLTNGAVTQGGERYTDIYYTVPSGSHETFMLVPNSGRNNRLLFYHQSSIPVPGKKNTYYYMLTHDVDKGEKRTVMLLDFVDLDK